MISPRTSTQSAARRATRPALRTSKRASSRNTRTLRISRKTQPRTRGSGKGRDGRARPGERGRGGLPVDRAVPLVGRLCQRARPCENWGCLAAENSRVEAGAATSANPRQKARTNTRAAPLAPEPAQARPQRQFSRFRRRANPNAARLGPVDLGAEKKADAAFPAISRRRRRPVDAP